MCEYSSLNIGASLEKMKMPVKWKAPHGKLRSECFAYFAITLTIVFSLRSNDSFWVNVSLSMLISTYLLATLITYLWRNIPQGRHFDRCFRVDGNKNPRHILQREMDKVLR